MPTVPDDFTEQYSTSNFFPEVEIQAGQSLLGRENTDEGIKTETKKGRSLKKEAHGLQNKEENEFDNKPRLQQTQGHAHVDANILTMKFQRPKTLWQLNEMWQQVNSTAEIFLYTAHYDDRAGISRPAVRVISVAETNITDIYCVLWYTHSDDAIVLRADVIPIGPGIAPNLVKWYGQYFLSCNVSNQQRAPTTVSITTLTNPYISNELAVHIAERPPQQLEFGHCMSVIYWNLDPYRVIEWLELHKMWGVSEVSIYSNVIDDVTKGILQRYVDEGFVIWTKTQTVFNDTSEATILLNMSPVINDCYYRNMYRYKRVVCTDFDEMIVPRVHGNYSSMLTAIDRQTNTNHTAPSYMFRNAYFFTDFLPLNREPWYILSTRYLRRIAPSSYGYSVKSITDTRTCIALQNHLCWKRVEAYDRDGWLVDVNTDIAMNQHYKKCHFDEYLGVIGACQKTMLVSYIDQTMLRFQEQLSKHMVTKLKQLHLQIAVA